MAASTIGRKCFAAPSSSAARTSVPSEAAAGIITIRAYTIPPTSVTAEEMCSHRMITVRVSPIIVSILAL